MAKDLIPKIMSSPELNRRPGDAKLAIIYCRISSPGQTGLGSQEHRCQQYAEAKEYTVVATFFDDVTGGGDFMKRKGMVSLLKFMDQHPERRFIVIFDDLRRYARDTEFHLSLRRQMLARGATRECLNFNFEDTPEGKFNETINAAVGELDRETNARQNRQKSIARLEQGYAVFAHLPFGYKYVKAKGSNSKVVVRDEPLASIVQEVLEGFASGRFASQAEAKRFLEAQPEFPKDFRDGTIRQQKVIRILNNNMYAGYVGAPMWGIPYRDGKHKGLISKATFEKIQERLKGGAYAPARKDLNKGFVLRGAVSCGCCGNKLTACSSKGLYKYYAYYLCYADKSCEAYGKSIPRAKIEGEFETLLTTLQPSQSLYEVALAMFRNYWNTKAERAKSSVTLIKAEIEEAEQQIAKLVDRIVETTNNRVLNALENRIDELEKQKLILAEKAQKAARPQPTFDEILELSLNLLANPYKMWVSGDFNLRRLVLRLVFSEPITYRRNEGFRTAPTSLPFRMLAGNLADFSLNLKDGAAGEI